MDPLSLISPAPEAWLFPPPGSRPGPGSGESTVTEHSGGCGGKRKRKYTEAAAATTKKAAAAAAAEDEASNLVSASSGNDLVEPVAKHLKVNGCSKTESESTSSTRNKMIEQNVEPSEPAKQDFIHVRARRGQATDSHSLAERARREKISDRMRLLQDLVPGCNKVIGKASVLDEIINYVQALQSQVEFLSMKLEAVTSRMNIGMEGFSPKEFGTEAYDVSSTSPFSLQPTREYGQGPATDWLHMQVGGAFERVT